MLIASPSQTDSVSSPNATRPAARATSQAMGTRGHAALTTSRCGAERQPAERDRRPGVRDVERGEPRPCGDVRLGFAEPGDRERRRVDLCGGGVRRDDRHGERAGERRLACLRVDQVVERASRAEAPRVATRGGDAAAVEGENCERLARTARVGDRDQPRAAFRRLAADGDVAAEIDEPAGEARGGDEHRVERAAGRVALADSAEVDGRARLEPGAAVPTVELDRRAGPPAVGLPGLSLLEQLERAVVAGGDERGQNRGIEAAAGVLPGAEREAERLEQPAADGSPPAAGCVEAGEVAGGVETGELAFAGGDLLLRGFERGVRIGVVARAGA